MKKGGLLEECFKFVEALGDWIVLEQNVYSAFD